MNLPHLSTETCESHCFWRESLSKCNMCDLAGLEIESVDYRYLCKERVTIGRMPGIITIHT